MTAILVTAVKLVLRNLVSEEEHSRPIWPGTDTGRNQCASNGEAIESL